MVNAELQRVVEKYVARRLAVCKGLCGSARSGVSSMYTLPKQARYQLRCPPMVILMWGQRLISLRWAGGLLRIVTQEMGCVKKNFPQERRLFAGEKTISQARGIFSVFFAGCKFFFRWKHISGESQKHSSEKPISDDFI